MPSKFFTSSSLFFQILNFSKAKHRFLILSYYLKKSYIKLEDGVRVEHVEFAVSLTAKFSKFFFSKDQWAVKFLKTFPTHFNNN